MEKNKSENKNWKIDNRSQALLACLPPLIFGSAVSLTWMVIGGPWYTATQSNLRLGLYMGLAVAGIIAIGGIIALIKRLPSWGYAWLGMDILGFLRFVQGIVEEGPHLLPAWLITVIFIAAMAFSAFMLLRAVLESWQAAGLVSIGMSTCMALYNTHLMAVGPYQRTDLAILGLICGLVFSICTYIYTRARQGMQIAMLGFIGLLNIAILYLANQVWSVKMAAAGKASPLVPLLVILLILLLAGPFAGLFRRPVKNIIGKLLK